MQYHPDIHHRRSIRIPDHDYSQQGKYYVTLRERKGRCAFGIVEDGAVVLSPTGVVVRQSWEWLGRNHTHVELDAYAIMPNHLHGIISLTSGKGDRASCRGGSRTALEAQHGRKPLGRLIGAFKAVCSKGLRSLDWPDATPLWQRNYYEHVIRDYDSLARIREYITNNPLRWELDRENPKRKGDDDFDLWFDKL